MRSVTFFQSHLSHFVETMATFLALDHQLTVRVVTSKERGSEFTEHPWILDRLAANPRVEVVDLGDPVLDSSLVVYGLPRSTPQPPALAAWLARAEASAIFPAGNHYGSRLDWLRELKHSFPHFLHARFLILERQSRPLDFRFGCWRRVSYAPSVHPNYLSNPQGAELMFSPPPEGPRRFRISFVGNRQPAERSARLDACLAALRAHPALSITADPRSESPGSRQALWIEYDLAAGTRGLDAPDYCSALADSDFCLSPPGWGLNWTHRTIEAMVRGAIPVIDDPESYCLPLVDGVNCVIVRDGNWARAVEQCLAFSPDDVAAMRAGVLRLREEWLLMEIAADRFRHAFMKAAGGPPPSLNHPRHEDRHRCAGVSAGKRRHPDLQP